MILVVSEKEKDTSSTSGMETSRMTSKLLEYRARAVVQPRLDEIEVAIRQKDFETFGRITMQDSNQFHAICMDTYPPIFYMNDVSKSIIRLVHVLNNEAKRIVAAYTFDAGPNAVIYTLAQVRVYATYVLPSFVSINNRNLSRMLRWFWRWPPSISLPPDQSTNIVMLRMLCSQVCTMTRYCLSLL